MKIVRFRAAGKTQYGVLTGDDIRIMEGPPFRRIQLTDHYYHINAVKLLSPCLPSKIVAIGLNYRSHATEIDLKLPDAPLIFLKPPTAVIGPEDDIVYPPSSKRVDYEGELGIVIKKRAWQVPLENSLDYVLGYTCFNDVTARDLQSQDGQWTRAKGFDTFAAIGPHIETEVNTRNLPIETWLNGELKQKGNTRDLIFNVPQLVSFASHVMTLLPGDVIATGTPEGIGPMQPGDTVEIRIEPIGTLRNHVTRK